MIQQPNVDIQTWVYPGPPSCSAMQEIGDGRVINTIKPQYYNLNDNGLLIQITDSQCNGYSTANAALVKAHSQQQFLTISGTIKGVQALANNATLASTCVKQLVTFLAMVQFTGVEIDVEDFSSWTAQQYAAYKNVVTTLGNALHANGLKLMIDGPVILNAQYQGYYQWKYEDFSSLPVDSIVSMCYDLNYDRGIGTPIATLQDIKDCCTWMKSKITDHSRIIIGINSYGYSGKANTYTAINQTYQQISLLPGFSTATRDASSGELMWKLNGMAYNYSDATTLNMKVQAVLNSGLSQVSIWHIGGGNPYPNLSPAPQPDFVLAAFNAAYPKFNEWYAANIG